MGRRFLCRDCSAECMEMRKLSPAGGCVTVSLPKDDLRERGLIDDDGELQGEHWAKVVREEDGVYRVELVSP